MKEKTVRKPLEGLKVADFTWVFVGPQTTKLLADCGAEVIRIESKTRPELWRTMGPFKDNVVGLDRSGPFSLFNTSKRSVTINLTHPRGLELAKRFVAWADVVVENFAGGVMSKIGLGYEELRKIKPDIIMLSSCMQGQTGPNAAHPGTGLQLTALSGFSQISGWPDRGPGDVGYVTDYIAPLFNFLAILAAIDYHRRTGKGQYLDMSQFEGGIHFIAPMLLDYTANQHVAGRVGNRSTSAAPHGVFRCRGDDRWCAIAVYTDEEWKSFCSVIGNPAWTNDPRFTTLLARKENEDELERLIEEWTTDHSAEEVMNMMQAAGVAAGVLQTGEDLLVHDPQLRHRQFFWELEHPEIGKYHGLAPSFTLSKSPCELRRAPLMGEDNEYALKEILGFSDEEIAELVIERVIE